MKKTLVLAAVLLAAAGCRTPRQRLADLRVDLQAREEALYARYGGGTVANKAAEAAAGSDGFLGDAARVAARGLRDADRSVFKLACRTVGGGNGLPAAPGPRAFLEKPENRDACVRIVQMDQEVRLLEAEVQKQEAAAR